MSKPTFGLCRICGKYGKLSREHLPPKGAFNKGEFKIKSINEYRTARNRVRNARGLVWNEKWRGGGNAKYVTCVKCNNTTGAWYAQDYIDFATACEPFARPRFAGIIGHIPTIPFYPLRVVKQAICSILAASQTEHDGERTDIVAAPSRALLGHRPPDYLKDLSPAFRVLPQLRQFVLDRDAKGLPEGVRLYLYLVASLHGRSSGFGSIAREDTGTYAVFSELAWFPLGWVLLCEGTVEEPIRDVTWWTQYDYDQQWTIDELSVSCQWAVGGPLEFRSPQEIEETAAENQLFLKRMGLM